MRLSRRILLVDDDPEILKLLSLTLGRAGYQTTSANAWEQVVEQINRASGERVQFDLVILDLMMPGRSGYDVLRSLKVIMHPLPPVIVLTALSGIDNAVQALELGAAKYLTKPISQEKLLKSVREALRGEGSRF